MKILRKNLNTHYLMNATGLALSVLLSLVFAGAISEMPAAKSSGDSAGTSALVSSASAAVPATQMRAAVPPAVTGADPRLDEFRLDADSCCISHY